MRYLLLASTFLSGIGQVMVRYARLFERQGHHVTLRLLNEEVPESETFDVGFAFLLPIIPMMDQADRHMSRCARKVRMTVCETVPVHPSYGLFERYGEMLVPSEFSRTILQTQFPNISFRLYRHYAEIPTEIKETNPNTIYTFYTIGNIVDFRKNVSMLIRAMLHFPHARLVLKATCRGPVQLPEDTPKNVVIFNDFMTPEQLDRLHNACHCYVSCSHSEGVGMGAVEAALRNKPVILSDFGGCKEYVKTPFVLSCDRVPVGRDEFLFQKHAIWGDPSFADLLRHMETCVSQDIRTFNHEHTQILMHSLIHKPLE